MYFQLRLTALTEKQVEVEMELFEAEELKDLMEAPAEGSEEQKQEYEIRKAQTEVEIHFLEKKKEYLNTQIFECVENLPQDMQRMMGNMMQGMTPEMLKMMDAMEDKIDGMGLEHLDDPEDDEQENN